MKTLKITKEQAQEIAGGNYFVGNLDECWSKAAENGYKGSFPVSRLDGAQFLNTDSPSWLNVADTLVTEEGKFWYKLMNVNPEWEYKEERSPNGWCPEYVSKTWVDKKTGIISYNDPTL